MGEWVGPLNSVLRPSDTRGVLQERREGKGGRNCVGGVSAKEGCDERGVEVDPGLGLRFGIRVW